MARLLYSLLLVLAAPLILIRLWWRGRQQPGYRRHLGERFGHYAEAPSASPAPTLWLHAVSVGEMRAAQPLVEALCRDFPEHRLLVSCMTPTGRETAQVLYGAFATVVYAPYDFPGAGGHFLDHFRPRLGLLMETEIWPNLLAAAHQRQIPVVLGNARLSARSAAGYTRLAPLVRPAFAALSEADAARLAALGAPPASVCGNVKFDVTPAPQLLALGQGWRNRIGSRPVVLAASTRDGEEALLLEAFARIRRPGTLLLLVPRHPQRFDEVAVRVQNAGYSLQRRSLDFPERETQVWLGDSMGEMAAYYACADLVVMGGSLKPFGSQNLIEAAACGCPVLVGPSDYNFAQATADALEAGAARRVSPDPAALAASIEQLLADEALRGRMREAALRFADAHRGATARTVAVIEKVLRETTLPAAR
jgi:3-deoxy-D-manno-octulosonic-acid transferase